jgi:hypothetical protein
VSHRSCWGRAVERSRYVAGGREGARRVELGEDDRNQARCRVEDELTGARKALRIARQHVNCGPLVQPPAAARRCTCHGGSVAV